MSNPDKQQRKIIQAERIQLFIASVTDYAIYMLSPDGIVNSWNAGAERFKGYTADEIIGKHFGRFYTIQDRAAERPGRALARAAEHGRFEDEGWRVRKDGTTFWASVVIDAIRDHDGVLLGFTKITRDITEKRRTEEALHASEERFRLLVQGVTDYAIYMLSPEGRVTNWNEGARRIKGYTADEVVGTHFSRFYAEEDQRAGLPMQALATVRREGRFEKEGWRVRKDGSKFWAHVVIDPIFDAGGALVGYAKVTRDVTERRNAAEVLERTKAALFQSQKLEAIGKLTGGIAHDFNNLLNVIINGIDLLRLTPDHGARLKVVDSMERAAQRGASLTQQLLTFARQQPVKTEKLDLNLVIGSFEAVLRRAVPGSVQLHLQLAPQLPEAEMDLAQFESALLNLVVNARDAVGSGGAIDITTAAVDLRAGDVGGLGAGRYVRVGVKDDGAGMPPDVMERALEPFFTTKEVGKGTGLGLSQVYGMVQQAGGDLSMASAPGAGTDIALYFPAIAGAADDASAAAPARQKILVVDDQPEVLAIAINLFQGLGYDVLAANNAGEALNAIGRHPDIGVLFTDVVMPGMNGIELAKEAKRRLPELKVLLASGYGATPLLSRESGADALPLLNKPYRLHDLLRHLKAIYG
ncbi:PAS domain S-box protein [Pseudoduganella sp. LjRoot289]|uniref:hybrid sensor histidine kinase/response regulator n=1 Tax=Pseudoduganella sp. LjRoot289 TaxID=3342314 RepID=UPI003ED0892D